MSEINPAYYVIAAAALALVPAALSLLTSYLKLSIVFGMIRSALGTQQVPGQAVIMALSLALTAFIMGPTLEACGAMSLRDIKGIFEKPTADGVKIIAGGLEPWREFLLRHSGNRELETMKELEYETVKPEKERRESEVGSLRVLVSAFVLTEVKEAFAMAFVLLLPFLVIDLVVANVLAGLGMFMVSPAMISLPLKLVLFVLSDGWLLLAKALISSYQV